MLVIVALSMLCSEAEGRRRRRRKGRRRRKRMIMKEA
jgi:hypothetical protein